MDPTYAKKITPRLTAVGRFRTSVTSNRPSFHTGSRETWVCFRAWEIVKLFSIYVENWGKLKNTYIQFLVFKDDDTGRAHLEARIKKMAEITKEIVQFNEALTQIDMAKAHVQDMVFRAFVENYADEKGYIDTQVIKKILAIYDLCNTTCDCNGLCLLQMAKPRPWPTK